MTPKSDEKSCHDDNEGKNGKSDESDNHEMNCKSGESDNQKRENDMNSDEVSIYEEIKVNDDSNEVEDSSNE